jgi:hypothetical protein
LEAVVPFAMHVPAMRLSNPQEPVLQQKPLLQLLEVHSLEELQDWLLGFREPNLQAPFKQVWFSKQFVTVDHSRHESVS